MAYVYVKARESRPPLLRTLALLPRPQLNFQTKRILAVGFLGFGVFLLASAILPILQFQFEYASKFGQIINPLSASFYNSDGHVLGDFTTDYTQLNNWFSADKNSTNSKFISGDDVKSYTLSIPNLKIKDAVVDIGSQDLKKSIIQYPQTALPGQPGSPVLFGHSVLPQFFNPKSYLTIFSTLYRLKTGDEIYINFDGIQYKYLVSDMFEVQPTDLSILEQRFDGRYLTIVTCSPPGTWLRRLVVRAQLADN